MARTGNPRVRLPFQRTAPEAGAGPAGASAAAAPGAADTPGAARAGAAGGASAGAAGGRRLALTGATVFYVVLAAVLAGYTAMAFGMEWQTTAGRIGPGLFPRVIGGLGTAAALLAAVQSALARPAAADPHAPAAGSAAGGPAAGATTAAEAAAPPAEAGGSPAEGGTGAGTAGTPAAGAGADSAAEPRHPWLVLALLAVCAAFVTVLVPVGAVVTGSLALIAALLLCDRAHPVRAVVLGVAFPTALYLVFVWWLNAPLPPGLLPL
ncbi:tripartite tricarboxylate transporter TctB family protein [Streptomonospora sp. S1-112]|uniref:Tripartite tricarboxylate transporter TctB family protein n=1 Tax=Streptomonospora mangrovi TaxID=2883123 RepID=A0A9X3NRB2_9ACTN|nr:tripartite tricarboxylate transporter TctB family protein [Streptomonospora mangrovi]MDA0567745.1 tripartite tricarboxylate transporter TctB family protein [Streptomonospora mangrovi]